MFVLNYRWPQNKFAWPSSCMRAFYHGVCWTSRAGQHALGTQESCFLSDSQSRCGEHYLSDCIRSIVRSERGGFKLLDCFSASSMEDYGKALAHVPKPTVQGWPVWFPTQLLPQSKVNKDVRGGI